MHRLILPAIGLFLAAALAAQQTHVIPNGMAGVPGAHSNNFPWGTSGSTSAGIRVLACYDSRNFTDAAIDYPILITRLRWRADDSSSTWAGGSYSGATISLSTAAVDYSAVSTTWATNHGSDLTVVHTGSVVMQPGMGNGPSLAGPFHVDVPLATPFVYDPTAGDLCIDCDWNGVYTGGIRTPLDVDNTVAGRSSRVFSSSQYPNANGTTQNHGLVVEVTYAPAVPDVATAFPYGAGCYEGFASFYEIFAAGTLDLSNSGITLMPTAIGYLALPGAGAWFTPGPTALSMAGNGVSPSQPLGFTLNFPGGSTTAINISSNGYIWAAPNFTPGFTAPTPGELLSLAARWAALWTDLDPSAGGVHFDTDPANNAAYVTFLAVPEAGTPANTNTFQVAFFASGQVEFRYQQCTVTDGATLVGWTPGSGARNPGPVDLTASLPIVTQPDTFAPVLAADSRPVTGNAVTLTASHVPAASGLGAFVAGLTQFNPGLDLTALGMADCRQYASLDVASIFVPSSGSGNFTFNVPNDPGLSGVSVYMQAAIFAPGLNALGVINSNGVDLLVGTL